MVRNSLASLTLVFIKPDLGKVRSGIKTPGPDESEQIKTGPSWVNEFGIRFRASVTPLIVALGTVNIVSTTDCLDKSSPWSI